MKITKAVKPISASLISLAIAGAVSAAPNQYGMSLQQELLTTENGAITARPQAAVNTLGMWPKNK